MSNLRDLLEYYVLASITTLESARAFCTKLATEGVLPSCVKLRHRASAP